MDQLIIEYEMKRKYSDDLAKLYYIIIWLTYGIYWISYLQSEPSWRMYNLFFSDFDFILLFWLLIEKSISPDVRPEQYFMQKPDIPEFSRLKFIFEGLIWGGIFFVVLQCTYTFLLVPVFVSADISSIQLSLALFRGVPPEELVFRGAMMSMMFFLFTRSEFIMKEFRDGNFKLYRAIWIGIAIISGVVFGLIHIPKYLLNNPNFPMVSSEFGMVSAWLFILYLSLLGIGLGLLRYKFGLFPCLIIHTLNNYYALVALVLLFS